MKVLLLPTLALAASQEAAPPTINELMNNQTTCEKDMRKFLLAPVNVSNRAAKIELNDRLKK